MSYLCTFSKTKENSCESLKKKKTVDMNHTNANDVEDGDNDVLYDIECCDPEDEEPDDILLSSDSESSDESDSED